MSAIADIILRKLDEVLARLSAVETKVAIVADDVDEIDRHLRPYGDGTRVRRGRR